MEIILLNEFGLASLALIKRKGGQPTVVARTLAHPQRSP
jgi:hypothetical protein